MWDESSRGPRDKHNGSSPSTKLSRRMCVCIIKVPMDLCVRPLEKQMKQPAAQQSSNIYMYRILFFSFPFFFRFICIYRAVTAAGNL